MLIRVPEAHSRSFIKAVSWRVVGSLDTFVIVWLTTGQLKFAGLVIGIETFTKIIIYYFHEQFWAWLPWWRPAKAAEIVGAASAPVGTTTLAPGV
ncbi:MAG TPA: DUF2061 domain-containing protein [Caulobacteraceae bacterium]|jgi:uncharacterized membrane protein|nr:DUF2061 domain-containing protein [Caulobacteraceae bacterium]